MNSLLLPFAAGGIAFVAPTAAAQLPQGKALVAYFSRSGNTRLIAGQISRALRADLFEINPATPYPPLHGAFALQHLYGSLNPAG